MQKMVANLTVAQDKGMVREVTGFDGKQYKIVVADTMMFSRKPAWHNAGAVFADQQVSVTEGHRFIDPNCRMDTYLKPLFYFVDDNKAAPSDSAMIVRHNWSNDDLISFGTIQTGIMSRENWKELNPDVTDSRYTRSNQFELIPPSKVVELVDKYVRDGNTPLPVESMGFLGKNGKNGLFMSFPMPSWDSDVVSALQTDVSEYLTVYITPEKGYVLSSSVIAVCQNTVMMAINQAARMLRFEHYLGATDRFAQALEGVYVNALDARTLAQETALMMLEKPLTISEMEMVAEKVYKDCNEPDERLIGVNDYNKRYDNYLVRQTRQQALRETAVELFTSDEYNEYTGITENMRGTAFGAFQVFTFMETHKQQRNPQTRVKELVAGISRRNIINSFNAIMPIVDPTWEIREDNLVSETESELA